MNRPLIRMDGVRKQFGGASGPRALAIADMRVSGLMPSRDGLVEFEAIAWLPQPSCHRLAAAAAPSASLRPPRLSGASRPKLGL